jgi:hypothetical protein
MINHTKEQSKEFLLSLNLINSKNPKEILNKLYSISNRIENNYKVYKIKKHNGNYRTIYSPKTLLKSIQRKILNNILNNKEISKYAKAYHKNISLKDNALPHLNKKLVLKLDIIDFFENIEYPTIYKYCFNEVYFPKSVGHLLTTLCTYESRLPQGAPTSSYISNLIMKDFDNELGAYCEKLNISYTRYSDDMTFSGDFNPRELISKVRKELYRLGLKINNKKIHVINNSQQQNVTGIVVNKKIQVSSKYRNTIRQSIYYIKKYGIKDHISRINYQDKTSTYINSLYGKILYILSIDPTNKEFISYKEYLNSLKKAI